MAIMKKINEDIERNSSLGENDIYRKFSKQFEKLFNSKESTKTKDEFESIYVSDLEFESEIKNFIEAETHTIRFCVGYTGIGKSTTIRHCFNLGLENKVFIGKNEVVFPSFFDGYQVSDIEKFDLSIRIASVCTSLEELHPELKSLLHTYEGKREFYDFIRRHTGFILERVNPVKAMDMDDEELIKEKLYCAYQENPFEFQANKLKFYMKKKYNLYNRLIIILDDIESLPENKQIEIIAKYLKLHECMQNTDFPDKKEYYVKILISVRPHTYSSARKNQSIEAFPIGEYPILKRKAVSLDSLFERRFQFYTKKYARPIGNQETWDSCYRELMKMNQAFEGQYKDMISNLCLMNIREALSSYSRVFANRYWVQRNKAKEEYFTVSPSEYSFNNINVIRALACNEEKAFWGDMQSIVVPNIFYTTKKDDLSIFCLLVMSYFIERKGTDYGMNARELKKTKKNWRDVLGSELLIKMQCALEFLFENKIICKSVLDFTHDAGNESETGFSDESLLYISPRGNEMFAMFKRDSVLLEMMRENVWRDYENRDYICQCSSDLMKVGKQDEIFKDLLEYIDFLYEMERNIRAVVKLFHREIEYENAFGYYPVVHNLLMGVKNSMEYSGYMNLSQLADKYAKLNNKIDSLMRW